MSPRGQVHNEQLRSDALAKITNGALKVFSEYGYHGATMKQITQATGLSYGLVYHYFPSKEAIFRHLVDFGLDSTIAAMQAVFAIPGTAWEKINRFSTMLVKNALSGKSSLYFLIMLQAMTQGKSIPGLFNHIQKRTAVYFETLAPLIVGAQKTGEAVKGDPFVLAEVYFAFLQGLALFQYPRKDLEKNITPEILISVLRNGAA